MNDDRISRLTSLKDDLQTLTPPEFPNPFWPLIDRWIRKATPTIRSDWNEHFADFEKSTIPSNNFRIQPGNSSARPKQQRQWELEHSETEEIRQKILSFLDGLLKVAPDSNKKPRWTPTELAAWLTLIGTILAALIGLIPLILNYNSTRPQVQATQIPATIASTPTLAPVATQPFIVFVTVEGQVEQKEPIFPLLVPAPVEVSIRVELPDDSADYHCGWAVLRTLPNPLPDTESCSWSVPISTFNDTNVRVTVFTSDGKSLERILMFRPE